MKKTIPNQLINQPDSILLSRKPFLLMMKKLLLLLVFAFYSVNISAQTELVASDEPVHLMEVNAYISSLGAPAQSVAGVSSTHAVEDLLYKVQPSVYYNSGVVKTYGEKPKNLFTDVASLSTIGSANILKNNIQIVTVRINSASQLNSTINLSSLSGFKSLKYVYIVSAVNVTQQALASKIINSNDRLTIFYKVDRGDKNQ